VTLYEQAAGFVAILISLSGFIWTVILYSRANRRTRVVMVALSWLLVAVLYWQVFFVLPEDWEVEWVAFMGLMFVFIFAVWGVIDLAIHTNVRLKGGEAARFAQGLVLLALSTVLFVATYFMPDMLDSLPLDTGFGGFFLGILGAALAAILCFRAGARAVYENRAAVAGLIGAGKDHERERRTERDRAENGDTADNDEGPDRKQGPRDVETGQSEGERGK
jgi:hypothetical protein